MNRMCYKYKTIVNIRQGLFNCTKAPALHTEQVNYKPVYILLTKSHIVNF
jgi:hypothetical protein